MTEMARDELMDRLHSLAPALRGRGVSSLALFGSRARRDNRPESDIDLLIEIEPDRKFSILDLVGLAHAVEDDIGLPANVFMRRSLDPEFLASVAEDEIKVF